MKKGIALILGLTIWVSGTEQKFDSTDQYRMNIWSPKIDLPFEV